MNILLAGREKELTWVKSLISDPDQKSGIIVGFPGVGKTTLLEAVLSDRTISAGSMPRKVLRLRGSKALVNMAFGTLSPMLTTFRGELHEVTVLREMMSFLKKDMADSGRNLPLLVVDDAQFMDAPSSFVLSQLIQSEKARVLLLSTDMRGTAGALDTIYDATGLDQLILRGFEREEVNEYCRMLLDGTVSSGTVSIIGSVTMGNPLLINSFVHSARTQKVLTKRSGIWVLTRNMPEPDQPLRDVIRDLHIRLPQNQQIAVEILALSGSQEVDILRNLVGADLGTAQHFGIMEIEAEQRIRIASPLYAAVMRSMVPPGRSEELRQRWLASRGNAAPKQTFRQVSWAIECGEDMDDEVLIAAAASANDEMAYDVAWRILQSTNEHNHQASQIVEKVRALLGMEHPYSALSLLETMPQGQLGVHSLIPITTLYFHTTCQVGQSEYEKRELHRRWQAIAREQLARSGFEPNSEENRKAIEFVLKLQRFWGKDSSGKLCLGYAEKARELEEAPGVGVEARIVLGVVRAKLLASLGSLDQSKMVLENILSISEKRASPLRVQQLELGYLLALVNLIGGHYGAVEEFLSRDTSGNPEETIQFHGANLLTQAVFAAVKGRVKESRVLLAESISELGVHDPLLLHRVAIEVAASMTPDKGLHQGRNVQEKTTIGSLVREEPNTGSGERLFLQLNTWLTETAAQMDDAASSAFVSIAQRWGINIAKREYYFLEWKSAVPSVDQTEGLATLLESAAQAVEGPRSEAMLLMLSAYRAGTTQEMESAAQRLQAMGESAMAMEMLAQTIMRYSSDGDERQSGLTVRKLHNLLREIGTEPWGVLTLALSHSELSHRELEIVTLAAAGKSNREIAEELTVSQRTVEGHLYRIFAKCGITDRTQLRELI